MSRFRVRSDLWKQNHGDSPPVLSAVLTGTLVPTVTEADIVTGGKTVIITLTGDTWVAAGATFDAERQNIINGLDSAQAEAAGWDAVVKATAAVTDVVRTSSTVVTITLEAFASYNVTATETITCTIPASALVSVLSLVATPTFTVTAVGASADVSAQYLFMRPMMVYSAGRAVMEI